MSKDNMSLYSAVANSYASMPLSALHELKSVLEFEIQNRLASFGINGEIKVDKALGKLGDVEGENTVFSWQNLQENNVLFVDFKRGNNL